VRLLLGFGADPCPVDASGGTALHYACAHGQTDCAGLLLAAGADPSAADDTGLTGHAWPRPIE
jgi:ankyrin repeat protein